MNYKFYVFSNHGVKNDLTLHQAIKEYKEMNTSDEYKALGTTKNGLYSCDLVNNLGENNTNRISNDYKSMKEFKNDKIITVNTIKILEKEFNLAK